MFVAEPVLAEMILQMLPPPPRVFGALALSELQRTGQPLACPSCGDAMKPTTIHEVELDHCPKHGVWFDQDELRITLFRVAQPENPPPFREWAPVVRTTPSPGRARPAPPPPPPRTDPAARRLVFDVGGHEVVTQVGIVKIGKLATSTLRLDDPEVSRIHAVIEVTPEQLLVIDLGSTAGTFVNGKRVVKATLQAGDVLRFGATDVRLVSAP